MKYQVHFARFATQVVDVDADSVDEVLEIAAEKVESNLCHYCAGKFELGDIVETTVFLKEEQVLSEVC